MLLVMKSFTAWAVTEVSLIQAVTAEIAAVFFQPTKEELVSTRTITVNPRIIEKELTSYYYPATITISSLIDIPQQVKAYFVQVKQNLDGTHLFTEDMETEAGAISPPNFILEPKSSQHVNVSLVIPTEKTGGIYAGIIFEATPVMGHESIPINKANAIISLTLPGALTRQGTITEVAFWQDKPKGTITIMSTFLNTGNIHLGVSGEVVVRTQSGSEIARALCGARFILPDCSHQLKTFWQPANLKIGTYTTETIIKFEDREPVRRLTPLMVIRPDEIAIAKLEIVSLAIPKAVSNSPACFKALLFNSGNIDLFPTGMIEVKNMAEEVVIIVPFEKEGVLAGSSKELKAVLAQGLPAGSYTALAKMEYDGNKAEAETKFNVHDQELSQKGEILYFTVIVSESDQSMQLLLYFVSTGEIAAYLEGIMEIRDSNKEVVVSESIEGQEIAPGQIWQLRKAIEKKLKPGMYTATATLIVGKEEVISKEICFLVGD